MDRWPGAYPSSEPPTPAPETPQQQQQQPQYPVQQQSQRQHHSGLAEQPTQTPAHHSLATEVKPQDIAAGHLHTDSGVGLSNAEHHRLKGVTLNDERNPSVEEAVGGGTYARDGESLRTQAEGQPKRNVQSEQGGQAAWPLSDVSVQHEQQPRKVHQYHPEEAQRVQSRSVQPQTQGTNTLSHGHEPSDLPVEYQQLVRDVLRQPHEPPRQSRAVQHQPHAAHGVVDLSHGHGTSDLPLEYQQNTLSQQPENLPQPTRTVQQQQPRGAASLSHDHQSSDIPVAYQQHTRGVPQQPHQLPQQSRAVQQQSHGIAASSDLTGGHQPSNLPLSYQQGTRSQQHQDAHHEDKSHSRSEQGLAAGALAGAGVAAHEYSGKHDEHSQQARGAHQQQQGTAGLGYGHQPTDLPASYQQHDREVPQQSTRSSHPATGSHEQTSTSTPPYWGSIPTAATGGIYNTVQGHGSAREDHDQHHNLPQEDRTTENTAADAAIPNATTSFPTGGVYNSVTGHGSGSEPGRQHDAGGRDEHDTGASRVPLLGAGHTRNGQDATGHSPLSGTESRNVQSTAGSSGPLHGSATAPSHSHDNGAHSVDRSTHGEAGTQRAFPLTTSEAGRHEDKSHSRTEQGLAAGALAGAGVAAYEYSGKHDDLNRRDTRDIAASHAQPLSGAEQRRAEAHPVSHATHGEKTTSHDGKEKRKGHHGLFGSSGKHDKDQRRDPRDIAPIPGTHPAGAEHRAVQAQPQAQAISPPNAEEKHKEHHGLFKHGNDEGRSPRDIAPIPGTYPAAHRDTTTKTQPHSPPSTEAKRSSLDGKESPKKKEHHGVFGIFHRNKDDKKEEDHKEHRRSGSIERRNTLRKDPPPKVAQAMRASTPPKKNSTEEDRHRQSGVGGQYEKRDHKGGLVTGAGVAAGGVAASELAHRHADSHAARQSNVEGTPHGTSQAGSYQTLPSGTPSGVATGATNESHQPSSMHNTSQAAQGSYSREAGNAHSGPYNTLADGTPSGIATGRAGGAAGTRDTLSSAPYDSTVGSLQAGHASDRSGQYDKLETGTASGIAAGAGAAGVMAASRGTEESAPHEITHASTGRTGLHSNTQSGTSGSGNDWRSELPPTIATSRVVDTSATHGASSHDNYSTNNPATSQATRTTNDTHSAGHTTGTAGPYNALESGTASGVAAAGAASAHRATYEETSYGAKDTTAPLTQRHDRDAGHAADLPNPYNVLPSGTPSGVNIEHRRRSKEIERQD
jgi:hypothetical protein